MRSFKKMGLLFMVLVIALAGLGVGFAAWTDRITISGTVETGSVCLEIDDYSGTWVYKDLLIDRDPVITTEPMIDPGGMAYMLVASAFAEAGPGDTGADVIMTWDNLFPCIDFSADFVMHYCGTVPAKLAWFEWGFIDAPEEGIDLLDVTVTGEHIGYINAAGTYTYFADPIPVGLGYQIHYCDLIEVTITIHVPQNNDLMNLSGSAWAEVGVVQWNEIDTFTQPAPWWP